MSGNLQDKLIELCSHVTAIETVLVDRGLIEEGELMELVRTAQMRYTADVEQAQAAERDRLLQQHPGLASLLDETTGPWM